MKFVHWAVAAAMIRAGAVGAVPLADDILQRMREADVVVLGEVHDNPAHHALQADLVAALRPGALVFEMLTQEQAARITPALLEDRQALAEALDWAASGWPDFAMYHPIMVAAKGAWIVGAAVPRTAARMAMRDGIGSGFGPEAGRYGLTRPLPPDEQAAREALQREAHCGALPEELLAPMVAVQRLRDATLARAAVAALDGGAGSVVVITGNGHARRDGGVPFSLGQAAPDLVVFTLGQSEDGMIEGMFDALADAPAVARPDPCDAFRDGQ